ncbi:MAG: hypothetical protein KBD94_12590 [Pyrinomonadaceae bacterium]|nr:hypothetical protein [Pyrinomonadaceae bacterium]
MKNAFCLLLLIAASCVFVAAQSAWIARTKPINGDLIAVFFTSAEKGWVAGDDGYLASTNDGGTTWTRVPLNTTESINEIYFRNDDNGYLVAGRKFFITRDGGRTWQDIRIYRTGEFGGSRPEFLSIRFSDKKRGYVIGSVLRENGDDDVVVDSLLMRTEDGGDTWRRIIVPTKTELFHLDFNGSSNGWIVGDNGVILASADSGSTWSKQDSGTRMPLYNVEFRDDREGYAVGKTGTILRTSNGGSTWERVATNFRDVLMRVDFADDKNGWIVGHGGSILRSTDKGRTWIRQESGTRSHLYGLYMDKKFGWAVGAKGTVLYFKR